MLSPAILYRIVQNHAQYHPLHPQPLCDLTLSLSVSLWHWSCHLQHRLGPPLPRDGTCAPSSQHPYTVRGEVKPQPHQAGHVGGGLTLAPAAPTFQKQVEPKGRGNGKPHAKLSPWEHLEGPEHTFTPAPASYSHLMLGGLQVALGTDPAVVPDLQTSTQSPCFPLHPLLCKCWAPCSLDGSTRIPGLMLGASEGTAHGSALLNRHLTPSPQPCNLHGPTGSNGVRRILLDGKTLGHPVAYGSWNPEWLVTHGQG